MVTETQATVFVKGTCACMARVADEDDVYLTQADIASLIYSIYKLSGTGERTAVTGHSAVSLSAADVIFDEMQIGDDAKGWDKDAVGYNFRHVIDISSHEAFDTVGLYTVEYLILPTSRQRVVLRFSIKAK